MCAVSLPANQLRAVADAFRPFFFFLCGHLGPLIGENAVGLSFKKKSTVFLKVLKVKT